MGLPPQQPGEHMVAVFLKLGPARHTAMGVEPWGWLDVQAFARMTGRVDAPWEFEALVEMSAAYVQELHRGEGLLVIPPTER